MKPAPFDYVRASTVEEALEALARYGGEAKPLAGGQSLVPMLNMRLLRPAAVVDLNGLRDLGEVRLVDGEVRIGALVRYSELERSEIVGAHLPLLWRAVRLIGDRQVRNRGTIGGSLAHGDPTGEMPVACSALDARVVVAGQGGVRELPVRELYVGPYFTCLEPTELIVEVVVPDASGSSCAYEEHVRRHGDFAVVGVAASGTRRADGSWTGVRLAVGGVAPTPRAVVAAEGILEGSRLESEVVDQVRALALEQADPSADARASAEYRLHLLSVYVERAFEVLTAEGRAA